MSNVYRRAKYARSDTRGPARARAFDVFQKRGISSSPNPKPKPHEKVLGCSDPPFTVIRVFKVCTSAFTLSGLGFISVCFCAVG